MQQHPPRGPDGADIVVEDAGVRVVDVVVEEQPGVGAPMERARERRVQAEQRLVVPPLSVLEQLRAPVAPERAGEGHAGDGVLQRPAPDLADGLAAGGASPVDADAAGLAHDVPVLALANQQTHDG